MHMPSRIVKQTRVVCISASILVIVSGCGPWTAVPELMVPEDITPLARLGEAACISVTGTGSILNSKGEPSITNEAFAKAVDLAIVKSGLVSEVVRCTENPQYRIDIALVHAMSKPGITRFSKTPATVVVQWKLTEAIQSQLLWEDEITTTFVLSSGGSTRGREALEGAARENIKKALAQLVKFARS